eukprot:5199793-Pyramimonas_sp.AAC.1
MEDPDILNWVPQGGPLMLTPATFGGPVAELDWRMSHWGPVLPAGDVQCSAGAEELGAMLFDSRMAQ